MGPESKLDRKLVRLATDLGWLAIKLTSVGPLGSTGWPDRLFVGHGTVFFMELKGGPHLKPTALQMVRHKQLELRGARVYVVGDYVTGATVLERETARARGET